ncbi:MAG: CPBP family intramembrane metalloprotease [Bdellovibrionales bacterium]|nr:CPBP family intramembrane metalloprotease [Bdellovibrionales bacterium]
MELKRNQIIAASVVVEGLLLLAAFVWSYLRSIPLFDKLTAAHLTQGVAFVVPLLFVNYILFGPVSDHVRLLAPCRDFRETVVRPLANALDLPTALFVSCLAGFGEELFFRGMLQTEFGIVFASVLFAVLHFGPAIRSYLFIALIYLLFGFYFGFLFVYSGSLWPPILTHLVYDFVVLLVLRKMSLQKNDDPSMYWTEASQHGDNSVNGSNPSS